MLAPLANAQSRVEIIDPDIRSVQAFTNSDVTTFPIIVLSSSDYITISFDDLNAKAPRNLMYKLIHCNESWQDEALFASDFIDGFNEQYLYNSGFSSNTSIRYVHYNLQFPNSNVKPKISGNYQLVVYDASSMDELLKIGFMVSEATATITGQISIPNDKNYQTSQQLSLSVSYPLLRITNPTTEIKTRVYQNYVELPMVLQPKPINYSQASIDYSRADLNIYPAGNEFRVLDIRDPHYLSTNASSVRQIHGQYYILLQPDVDRSNLPYSYSIDYNGKMVIAGLNVSDPDTQNDYYSVLFSLKMPFLGNDLDLYLEGELTGWGPSNSGKMMYNNQTGCYEVPLTLKQGYYNYMYIVRNSKGVPIADKSPEGSYSQTQNTYQIFTYYKGVRDIYTKLIGSATFDQSRKLNK